MAGQIVVDALLKFLALLQNLGLKPVLVGGLAVQAWGRIRQTKDVDVLVHPGGLRRDDLFAAAERLGLSKAKRPVVELGGTAILRLLYEDPRTGMTVNLDLIESAGEFFGRVIDRSRTLEIFDRKMFVASCEDLILMKLLADRPIDEVDAAELARINRDALDMGYLNSMAAILCILPSLKKCIEESDRG